MSSCCAACIPKSKKKFVNSKGIAWGVNSHAFLSYISQCYTGMQKQNPLAILFAWDPLEYASTTATMTTAISAQQGWSILQPSIDCHALAVHLGKIERSELAPLVSSQLHKSARKSLKSEPTHGAEWTRVAVSCGKVMQRFRWNLLFQKMAAILSNTLIPCHMYHTLIPCPHTLMPCASLNRLAFFVVVAHSFPRLVHTASFLRLKAEMEIHQIKPNTSVRKAKHTRNSNPFASPGKHLFPLLQLALAQKRQPLVHHPSKHPVGGSKYHVCWFFVWTLIMINIHVFFAQIIPNSSIENIWPESVFTFLSNFK